MPYIFGPVPSRRLGFSLGIDLIPAKTCSYDCLYCQVGRTTCSTVEAKPFTPIGKVLEELEESLKKITPDVITLSGSGEPTLHSEIDQVIAFIKGLTNIKIALLTNGSLLWKKELRSRVSRADILIPTLSTVFENTFKAIHRPHSDLSLPVIIEGLKDLRQEYQGRLFLEVILLAGFNDSEKEIEGLKGAIDQINPDKVQLNTVVRPPADSRAISLDRQRLEDIKNCFGGKAEIIVGSFNKQKNGLYDSLDDTVLEMARRRPIRVADISNVLNLSMEEVERLIKKLIIKGALHKKEHSGEAFYTLEQGG